MCGLWSWTQSFCIGLFQRGHHGWCGPKNAGLWKLRILAMKAQKHPSFTFTALDIRMRILNKVFSHSQWLFLIRVHVWTLCQKSIIQIFIACVLTDLDPCIASILNYLFFSSYYNPKRSVLECHFGLGTFLQNLPALKRETNNKFVIS